MDSRLRGNDGDASCKGSGVNFFTRSQRWNPFIKLEQSLIWMHAFAGTTPQPVSMRISTCKTASTAGFGLTGIPQDEKCFFFWMDKNQPKVAPRW